MVLFVLWIKYDGRRFNCVVGVDWGDNMDDARISPNQSDCILFGVAVFSMVVVRVIFERFNIVFELKNPPLCGFFIFSKS